MRSIVRVLVTGLLMVLCVAGVAQAQGTGVLEGEVVSGTAGGPEVGAGLTVVLHVIQGDSEMNTLETTTDAQGQFRFEGLDTDPSLEYWPEVTYLGVGYGPVTPFKFSADQPTKQATVTVYETTEDDSAIALSSVHVIAESFGQALRISEIHLFRNAGDRTYVGQVGEGGQRGTLEIPLPAGAVGLALQDGSAEGRFIEVASGWLDTEPVPPGSEGALAFFSYHLMVGGDSVPVERRFAYPVSELNILAAQPGLSLSSTQLQSLGIEQFQGQNYERWGATMLPANQPVTFDLLPQGDAAGVTGMPGGPQTGAAPATAAAGPGNQNLFLWLGLALAVVAVTALGVYSAARPRPQAAVARVDLASDPRGRELLRDLADATERFEAGAIDEPTYESYRAELYDKLKSL
jgi:hypothetical protein